MASDRASQDLPRGVVLLKTAGMKLAAGGAAFYFTHPQRVVAELPSDLAAVGQDVYRPARDGAKLHAIWIPGSEGRDARPHSRTIVHSHGFNGSGGLVLARKALYQRGILNLPAVDEGEPLLAWPLVDAALARGYNFLLVDSRAHGRSGGRWDTTGVKSMSDLMGWATWLRNEHDQLWVGLWGNSFGASVGLALATRPVGGGFDAMVLDSPAIVADGLYSGVIQGSFYQVIQPVLWELSNKDLVRRLETEHVWMPILLIHGAADTHVPAWQSQRVYDLIRVPEAPERTGLWIVPGADHLESLEVAPAAYIQRTLDWFDKWFG